MAAPPTRYRLYLDEAGDHGTSRSDADALGRRYLCLLGVMVRMGEPYTRLQGALEQVKRDHLPYDPDAPPILHREDILNGRGPFYVLQDPETRTAFDSAVIELVRGAPMTLFGVVIDKYTHGAKRYRMLTHAYHYCLTAMLERYCGLLGFVGGVGDVLAEARGKVEDRALEAEYRSIWENGTSFMARDRAQKVLTSRELKVKPKGLNVAGLQIADLLAHPVLRDVLLDRERVHDRGGAFADRIIGAVVGKYNHHRYDGRVRGYGRILLS